MLKFIFALILICATSPVFAQHITESLDNWTFGPNQPTLQSGTRGDGTSGAYHYLPVGTSAYYYELSTAGEGMVEFWIYDPFKCSANPDPGYGSNGMRWGIQNPLYQAMTVGDSRNAHVAGCIGYSPWSTVAPYSPYWFKDGIRGANGLPWAAGWWKWSINGTFDAATFTLYNVTYCIDDGPPDDDVTTGNCTQTYDATFGAGVWAALFGSGWKAFWLKGDVASTGIEDPYVDVVGGTGIFIEFSPPCFGLALPEKDGCIPPPRVNKPYSQTTWGNIKALHR